MGLISRIHMVSDWARGLALYLVGGIYFDIDSSPKKETPNLSSEYGVMTRQIVEESHFTVSDKKVIVIAGNDIDCIAASQKNIYIKSSLRTHLDNPGLYALKCRVIDISQVIKVTHQEAVSGINEKYEYGKFPEGILEELEETFFNFAFPPGYVKFQEKQYKNL